MRRAPSRKDSLADLTSHHGEIFLYLWLRRGLGKNTRAFSLLTTAVPRSIIFPFSAADVLRNFCEEYFFSIICTSRLIPLCWPCSHTPESHLLQTEGHFVLFGAAA